MTQASPLQHDCPALGQGRAIRLAEGARPEITFYIDGTAAVAQAGDTVLTAILMSRRAVRHAEFGPEERAGFCLMGACQDCWIWTEEGHRLRACSTPIRAGMRLCLAPPDLWPAGMKANLP
ncbi:(2Fe-2S)-binding protein [Rhodobacteraceae bacterium]|nr:(2Fe-2S)-binding protein [Paracoccaceae bacterium]